jgi:energy-coupling factor transporter ATP-binding protein EcfA2
MISFSELAYSPRGLGPLSMTLASGQVTLLCGPSGSGKSTLCSLLSGELDATSGQLHRGQGLLATMSSDVENQLLGATVGQELELGYRLSQLNRLTDSPEAVKPGANLLLRWRGREAEDPHSLSAGEQQLLLLSSLAVGSFSVLILDEGLSCLDDTSFVDVCRALKDLAQGGLAVLLVSHEFRTLPWVDRCAGLSEGRLVFDKSAETLCWDDLRQIRVWTGAVVPPADGSQLVLGGASARCAVRPAQTLGCALAAPVRRLMAHRDGEVVLAKGEMLAVAGVTGSGKSRLLMAMAGHHQLPGWQHGDQDNAGREYTVLLRQQASGMLWRRTVAAELEASFAQGGRREREGGPNLEDLWEIPEAWRERSPRSLSQGQLKLVTCLCLLLQRPDLLLLDEPFSGLDADLRGHLELRLRQYLEAGGRAVFTTHRPDEMVLYGNRLLVLEDGAPTYLGDPWTYFDQTADPRLGSPGGSVGVPR